MFFFFFNDTATTEIYTLSLHDALPISFRLDALQLRQQDFEPIQLAHDLRLQVHRQGPAVACPQLLQPLTPTLAQRLVAEHPLGKEQPFDPVALCHPPPHHRLALPADTPAVPPP